MEFKKIQSIFSKKKKRKKKRGEAICFEMGQPGMFNIAVKQQRKPF